MVLIWIATSLLFGSLGWLGAFFDCFTDGEGPFPIRLASFVQWFLFDFFLVGMLFMFKRLFTKISLDHKNFTKLTNKTRRHKLTDFCLKLKCSNIFPKDQASVHLSVWNNSFLQLYWKYSSFSGEYCSHLQTHNRSFISINADKIAVLCNVTFFLSLSLFFTSVFFSFLLRQPFEINNREDYTNIRIAFECTANEIRCLHDEIESLTCTYWADLFTFEFAHDSVE